MQYKMYGFFSAVRHIVYLSSLLAVARCMYMQETYSVRRSLLREIFLEIVVVLTKGMYRSNRNPEVSVTQEMQQPIKLLKASIYI